MVHGTVKGLLGLISTLVLVVVAAFAVAAFRLSRGPVSLSFLTPTIEQELDQIAGGNVAVTLDETVLVWDGEARTLSIHLHNVRAATSDGRAVAALPDATVSLAGMPLLVGRIAVRGVRVIHPHLRLLRTASGEFALGLGENSDADAAALLDRAIAGRLIGAAAPSAGGGVIEPAALTRVEIIDGDLVFDDKALDMRWYAPQVDLLLARTATGMMIGAHGPLTVGDQEARIDLVGDYQAATKSATGSLKWSGIRPAFFARMIPSLGLLARLQLVTGGTADFTYTAAHGLADLAFDLTGGAGALDIAPWVANPVRVSAAALKGKMTDQMDALALDSARLDLGGPKLMASGKASQIGSNPHVELNLIAEEMPVDTAKALWPAAVVPNARGWVAANLSGGVLKRAELKLAFSALLGGAESDKAGKAEIESMSGSMRGEGIAIHYFGELPPARNVAAEATFDKDSLTINVKSGSAGGVQVKGGTVKLAGFLANEQTAAINLDLAASVRDALRVIDAKPLGYATLVGFDPERAKGDATVALQVGFPLIKSLRMAQVNLHAHVRTAGLAVPKAAFGLDLANGALDIEVDPKGMEVEGKADLGAIPIDLKWQQNFGHAAFRSRYIVKAALDDAERKTVGLDDPALQAPVLTGTVPVDVTATFYDGGLGEIALEADLGPAALKFPGLDWSKPPGVAGAATARLRIDGGGITAVETFAVTAASGMELRGDIAFDPGNRPRRVSLTTAKWGHSDFKANILFKPDDEFHIDVTGNAFDASELVGGGPGGRHLEEGQKLTVEVKKLARVWLSGDGSIQNVDASLAYAGGQWNLIKVNAAVGQNRAFRAEVKPANERGRRSLRVICDDAGALFNAFGILKTVRGGTLTIDGTYLDSYPDKPLEGDLRMADYRVVKAPLLARIFTVASLTGARDVLSGEGIHFKKAETHFTLAKDVITLKDARASGTEIGLTAKGQINLDNDQLALAGTIVPAYSVNSAVGDIPVIGSLLQGHEGEGLIGFNYTVHGEAGNPDVSVNPLSALTPGFLRGLFGLFDGGGAPNTVAPPRSGGQAPQPQDRSAE